MDFTQVNLFGKKSFSDLLKEIHSNQKDKEMLFSSLQELDQKIDEVVVKENDIVN